MDKSGNPIRVEFRDTLISVPEVRFGQPMPRYPDKTTDTTLDRLVNALLGSG